LTSTYFFRTLFNGLALTVALTLTAFSSNASERALKMSQANWTSGQITCTLIKTILESEMGYRVESFAIPSDNVVVEAIIAGELDFGCESWPSYNTWKDKYVSEWNGDGSIAKLGDSGVVGERGYYVPRYLIEGDADRDIEAKAPELKSYEQLNDHVDLFKTNASSDKGRLLGCPVASWDCMDLERVVGLNLNYEPVELGSEVAHWTEIESAYARGDAFLAYVWEPHWIHTRLDLVEIILPKHSEAAWPVSDWPLDVTFNYGSPHLVKDHPEAAKLITNMSLTNKQQAQMIFQIEVNLRDTQDVVNEWLAANESVWQAWLAN